MAILPVHLYGQPADMESIGRVAGERGLAVVEDACQAHGAAFQGRPCGSLGVTAAFSFYPGKNLGALGDGGAVVTGDAGADRTVRLLRNHGELTKSVHEAVGYCDRLHNLQAGFLLVKLPHLAEWNNARSAAARRYDGLLAAGRRGHAAEARPDVDHVYHLYVVQVDDRDAVRAEIGGTRRADRHPLSGAAAPHAGVRRAWATAPATSPSPRHWRRASSACPCTRRSPPGSSSTWRAGPGEGAAA